MIVKAWNDNEILSDLIKIKNITSYTERTYTSFEFLPQDYLEEVIPFKVRNHHSIELIQTLNERKAFKSKIAYELNKLKNDEITDKDFIDMIEKEVITIFKLKDNDTI
jgi:hypothetical protein